MSAPEQIWATESKCERGGRDGTGYWASEDFAHSDNSRHLYHPPEQYTRTDLIPAMIQAAVDAEREAILVRIQRMYEHALDRSDADLASDWKSHSAAVYGVCLAAIRARKGGAE